LERQVGDASFLAGFGDEPIHLFKFNESWKISSYLFCFIAGPYSFITSDEETIKGYKYPLRLACRKSLTKYLEKAKEEMFHNTKCAIEYYEKIFQTPYPFDKLDQAFVPDYECGAMENVGLILYNDQLIEREELFS